MVWGSEPSFRPLLCPPFAPQHPFIFCIHLYIYPPFAPQDPFIVCIHLYIYLPFAPSSPFYILPSLHQIYKSQCISMAWTLFNQNCYCSSCLDPFTKSSYMIHYFLTFMACNWDTTQIQERPTIDLHCSTGSHVLSPRVKRFWGISQDLTRR